VTTRSIDYLYKDPLDLIWTASAQRLGWNVVRSDEVFASWDGVKVLTISSRDEGDADDHLGQMIFHEMCHALIEGERGYSQVDWGLSNFDERDIDREYACHRLQAALADEYKLRAFLAVTTDWRPYYDALPPSPLLEGSMIAQDPRGLLSGEDWLKRERAVISIARHGAQLSTQSPWREALHQALSTTAQLRALITPFCPSGSLWTA
jgi:hypothetical protein